MNTHFNSAYAAGKFYELVHQLTINKDTARIKLSQNHHFFAIIMAKDFKHLHHQDSWKKIQKLVLAKIKNYGSDKYPNYRITIRNKTIETVLCILWDIFDECFVCS